MLIVEESDLYANIAAYSISDDIEKQIRSTLMAILTYHNCDDLLAPIYTSVKELLINAIKANYKNIYFENYTPASQFGNHVKYETALQLFQLELSRENSLYLEEIARKDGMKADIEIWAVGKTLHVKVSNPVNMTETELSNVKQKLTDAEHCIDLADYFLKNMSDPLREGAGLGLILIMMMLKSLRAEKDSLTIQSENDMTIAYLKIPLVNAVLNCA
ncbi:MAG: hypothetical protein JW807_11630 [Spirochaetes bacterium]|nr:hypothetical protein [Spirochaetota bacterium]